MTDTTQTAGADLVDSIVDAGLPAAATETAKPAEAETTETKDPAAEPAKTYTADDIAALEKELARERRRIGKITAQKYQEKARADQYNQQIAELQKKIPQTTGEPQIGNYTDYNKYQQDVIDYRINLATTEKNKTAPQQPTQEDYQKQLWREHRRPALVQQVQAASQTFPDMAKKLQANTQLLDSLPSHVADAFLEADNGAVAIYQLLEDGMIPHLAGMNADTVQALIEKAEDKALSRRKPASTAPAPLTAARGTAPGSKSPADMSGDELRKWMAS